MELLPDENVIWQGHPTWRSTIMFWIKGLVIALIPIAWVILAGALDWSTGLDSYQWVLIAILIVAVTLVIDVLRRQATVYTVTTRRLHIRRGILSRREQSTHIDRVQNINTSQSILERMLNVGSVDFDTAGSESNEASFAFEGVSDPHGIVARIQPTFARAHPSSV